MGRRNYIESMEVDLPEINWEPVEVNPQQDEGLMKQTHLSGRDPCSTSLSGSLQRSSDPITEGVLGPTLSIPSCKFTISQESWNSRTILWAHMAHVLLIFFWQPRLIPFLDLTPPEDLWCLLHCVLRKRSGQDWILLSCCAWETGGACGGTQVPWGLEEMSKKLQRQLFLWRSRRLFLTGRCAEFQYELGLFYYSRTLWKYPKSHCLKMLWDQDLSCQEQRSVPQPASSRHIFWEQTMDRRARYTECLSSNMNARPSLHFCTTVCK